MRQNIAVLSLFLVGSASAVDSGRLNVSLAQYKQQALQNLAQLEIQSKIDTMESGEDDEEEKEEAETPPADARMDRMKSEVNANKPKVKTPSTAESLNDEDAKCYAARYNDIDAMLDPKTHYSTVGIEQGRLGTCAKKLTTQQAQKYLDNNPDLQRQFGNRGQASLEQAKEHWQTTGYKNSALAATIEDGNKPFKCADSADINCNCPGTVHIGPKNRPDSKQPITTFDEMREWRTMQKESDGWITCRGSEFDTDPDPGHEKQCFCEIKNEYTGVRCADEGDQCFCSGHIYFTKLYANEDKTQKVTLIDAMELGFAIIDNTSGQASCSSDSFAGADPFPGMEKQCFCDAKRKFTGQDDLRLNQQYWGEQSTLTMSEIEAKTLIEQVEQAETIEKTYTETIKEQDTSADVVSASCDICNHECSADTEKTLSTEISKRKTVITQKFTKLKEINKNKQTIAEQKKVQGEASCAQAQKSKNPAEKKKYLQMCTDLKIEASKIITEVTIERSTIEEQQRQEEHILQEETESIITQKETKNVDTQKIQEINKSKLIESQATRIAKETEEQISVIKQKVQTERYEQQVITSQTTVMEKQVTNIQQQIEQTEQTIIREIQEEKEESDDAGEEVDEAGLESEEELTKVIEEKKTDLEEKKTSVTTSVETYTSKTTELESTIETTTKKMTEIKEKIDKKTTETNTLVSTREELKTQLKVVAVTEKSKIQESIDKITTDITTYKKETETMTSEREDIVIEETTARTELTFTSQSLKQATIEKEKIEEQITVTQVVIDSKKEETTEQTEKVEIIKKQISAFKKKQELLIKKEEIKNFKTTINTQISKKTKIKETNEITLTTQKEELKTLTSNCATYETELKSTKDDAQKKIIETKIESCKKEETSLKEVVDKLQTVVTSVTSEITELTSGKSVTSKEEEVKTLEKEVTTIITEATSSLNNLPIVKNEVTETIVNEDGTTSTTSTSSTTTTSTTGSSSYSGVVSSITIKGNLGGSSSTSTSTTDITTQVIEKQETATKMREEATRIKEVAISQTTELEEIVTLEKKIVEEAEKTITKSKDELTILRTKEKEINTKISTSTETSEVESYRKELTVVTGSITTTKESIKTTTEKKVSSEEKITDSKTIVTELKSKVETAEEEAKSVEEEAITFISEGIEATYVVNKQQVYEKKIDIQKKTEQEYGSKKVKFEEETSRWNKKLTEKKTLKSTTTSELKDTSSRCDSLKKRLDVVKDEEKKTVEKEITSCKAEVTRYEKLIETYTSEITTISSTIKTIYTSWTTYYTYYIKIRAESTNSLQVSRQIERTSMNRIRKRNHKHSHKHRVIQIKQKALSHRHAVTETKKRTERQTRQYKRQQTAIRISKIKSEQRIKTSSKTITTTEKKIKEMKEKKTVIKSETEKTKIEDEIAGLEATIETEKSTIKTETTKKTKIEDDEATISTKIVEAQETVSRIEKETVRIETEAKSIETSFSSETSTKVSKEVKKIKKEIKTKKRNALKQKIKNLKKVINTKKEKITTNTKKIISQTKSITKSSSKIAKVTEIRDRQTKVSKYAGCQRLLVEQPSFFEMTTICAAAVSRMAQIATQSSSVTTTTSSGSVVGPSSSTCQICYSQNTACNGGGSLSGISVVSFAVDTQGEAETIIDQLFSGSLVGDVNFVNGQVNPKYQVFGAGASASQTKVELVTSDAKVQQVVQTVNSWKASNGKSSSGKSSEAQVSALTGGSQEYIRSIQKATGIMTVIAEPRSLRSSAMAAVQQTEGTEEMPKPKFSIENFIARVYE